MNEGNIAMLIRYIYNRSMQCITYSPWDWDQICLKFGNKSWQILCRERISMLTDLKVFFDIQMWIVYRSEHMQGGILKFRNEVKQREDLKE